MAQSFITAVVLRRGAVECTTVRAAKDKAEVVERKTAELPPESQPEDLAAPEVVAALKTACGHLKGDLCVAVPADKVLLRVVDLPTVDPGEIAGMAELQVDKFSPFPVEHMAVSCERLSQAEGTSRVLIAAVQKDVIRGLGEGLGKVGLLPHSVDVDVLGWWFLLKQEGQVPDKGRRVFLVLDHGATEMVISQDGVPVVFRSLGGRGAASDEEFFAEIAEEVGYTLTALEAERGAAEAVRLSIWHWGDRVPPKAVPPAAPGAEGDLAQKSPGPAPDTAGGLEALVGTLRAECGVESDVHRLDGVPPLSEGLARRALARGPLSIELAPAEWRAREESRRLHKALLVATVLFFALWLTGVGAFVGGLTMQKGRLSAAKEAVEELEGPAEQVRVLRDKVKSFEQYADRSHSALEALREISALLPGGVDLTSFSYKKANTVTVRGEAGNTEPIYAFFQALQQSAFFTAVKPGDVRSKQVGNVRKSEFSVTCKLPGEEEP